MKTNFSITAIILAGGMSSRMKCEKAFLKLGSKTIIEELISRLEKRFSKIIIIANDTKEYMKFGIKVVSDILPEKGPLGAIFTALVKSDSFYNFVFACDMPFINQDLVKFMLEGIYDYDVVIPEHNEQLEPLYAIYSKNCIKPIEKELHGNNLKITSFLQYVKVRRITAKETARFDSDNFSFININTPDDYRRLKYAGS